MRTERHINDVCVSFNSIIKTEHKIGGAGKRTVSITFSLDHDNVDLGSYTYDTLGIIHRSSYNTRNTRSVSLLILNQRPIIRTAIKYVILYDLIFGCII